MQGGSTRLVMVLSRTRRLTVTLRPGLLGPTCVVPWSWTDKLSVTGTFVVDSRVDLVSAGG
jgi:hypothetical protein